MSRSRLTVRMRLAVLAGGLFALMAGSHLYLWLVSAAREAIETEQLSQQERVERYVALQEAQAALGDAGAALAVAARDASAQNEALRVLTGASRVLDERVRAIEGIDPDIAATLRAELLRLPEFTAAVLRAGGDRDGDAVARHAAEQRRQQAEVETQLRQVIGRERERHEQLQREGLEAGRRGLRRHGIVAFLVVLGSVGLFLAIGGSVVRPLERVLRAVRQVKAGPRALDLPESPDEFGEVAAVLHQYRAQAEHMQKMSSLDSLTGLASRSRLDEALRIALERTGRVGGAVALMFMDIDNFRSINESLGHTAGDQYLAELARRLRSVTPHDGLLCRYSGDKFVLLMERVRNDELLQPTLRAIAERILQGVLAPYTIGGHQLHTSLSIGVAVYPRDGADAEQLVSSADAAMYLAKRSGRNNAQFANPALTRDAHRSLAVSNDIRRGLENDEFEPYYQPIINVATGETVGAEALIRWRHPQLGLVLPGEFIRVAEQSGLVGAIGERCLSRVCTQASIWRTQGRCIPVAVNLSARQLQDRRITTLIEDLHRLGMRGEDVSFEITESTMMEHPERSLEVLQEIKSMGHRLCIDDFGTGYSSLAYLQRFPLDRIKLDRAFVAKLESSRQTLAIISATLTLSRNLGLEIVAEGVETMSQMRRLHELGCDLQQGFFFTHALPAADFERWTDQSRLPIAAKLREA